MADPTLDIAYSQSGKLIMHLLAIKKRMNE